MNDLLNEFSTEFEEQRYIDPNKSLGEQNAFIDNLRSVQNANNAQINTQTTNLGTYPAPQSNLGGLGGADSYFTARQQIPQGVAIAANLRAQAQAQALNEALKNNQEALKQRYNKAYQNYRKRAASYGGGGGDVGGDPDLGDGGDYLNIDNDVYDVDYGSGSVSNKNIAPGTQRTAYVKADGYSYTQDVLSDGRTVISNTDNPNYIRASDGYMYEVPSTDSFLGMQWGISDEERKRRADNISQLNKIRNQINN